MFVIKLAKVLKKARGKPNNEFDFKTDLFS